MNRSSALVHSFHEFRNVRTLTATAMFAAVSIVLGYLTLEIGPYIKVGFSTISNQFVYLLFGPAVGAFFGGALDVMKYVIKPTGPYFPGFTISAALAGFFYGSILYRQAVSLKRILAAELLVNVICNMFLGTLWLTMLYGKGFFALFPMRVFKNLIMWPVNSMLFYSVAKVMETSGIFHLIKPE